MIDPAGLPPCVFLAGPTATGKSSLGVEIALAIRAEIVSADSMLVRRGMDVGTAKPTPADMSGVPHHLIDVVDPSGDYDAARFRDDALSALSSIASRGARALVVGGTGLYLRALAHGLAAAPPRDTAFRAALRERARLGSVQALHAELAAVDPEAAAAIHPNDLVRIERALEILHSTGRPASVVRGEHGFRGPGLDVLYLVLDVPPRELRARIDRRARAMVESGLLDETARLLSAGFGRDLGPMRALNYRHACEVLSGDLPREGLDGRMAADTWRFARRQRRWFRSEAGARQVAPDPAVLIPEIERWLDAAGQGPVTESV